MVQVWIGGFAVSSGIQDLLIFLFSHPEHELVVSWAPDGWLTSSMAFLHSWQEKEGEGHKAHIR